jgi:hypothetical protein
MEYRLGRAKKVEKGPWRRGNPIIEIWSYGTQHTTKYDLRVSPHDGPFSPMEGGRRAAVFDSTTGEKNGSEVRVRGLLRRNAIKRAGILLEEFDRRPSMP